MLLLKPLVLSATLALAGTCLAQPAEPPKKETTGDTIARIQKERKDRVMSDFQKQLRDKFKLSDADVIAVQTFVTRQDEQLQSVRSALYQVTLAAEDDMSDDEFAVFLNDFQMLAAKYRAQRTQETARLEEQLGLSKNVRLRAFLLMRGVIGEEVSLTTPISQNIVDSDLLQYRLKRELGVDKPKRVVVPADQANG